MSIERITIIGGWVRHSMSQPRAEHLASLTDNDLNLELGGIGFHLEDGGEEMWQYVSDLWKEEERREGLRGWVVCKKGKPVRRYGRCLNGIAGRTQYERCLRRLRGKVRATLSLMWEEANGELIDAAELSRRRNLEAEALPE